MEETKVESPTTTSVKTVAAWFENHLACCSPTSCGGASTSPSGGSGDDNTIIKQRLQRFDDQTEVRRIIDEAVAAQRYPLTPPPSDNAKETAHTPRPSPRAGNAEEDVDAWLKAEESRVRLRAFSGVNWRSIFIASLLWWAIVGSLVYVEKQRTARVVEMRRRQAKAAEEARGVLSRLREMVLFSGTPSACSPSPIYADSVDVPSFSSWTFGGLLSGRKRRPTHPPS